MNIITVVPPPFEPVSVAECYAHLRWDWELDDSSPPEPFYPLESTIRMYIAAARKYVEQATKRCLIQQTLRINYSSLPEDVYGPYSWSRFWGNDKGIELLQPPLIRVESVGYYNGENSFITVDPDDYFVTDDLVPRVQFIRDFHVTDCVYGRPDAAQVTYVAGYPPEGSPIDNTQEAYAANVPEGLKTAVLLGVQLLADRFDVNERADLTRARDALLSPFTVWTF